MAAGCPVTSNPSSDPVLIYHNHDGSALVTTIDHRICCWLDASTLRKQPLPPPRPPNQTCQLIHGPDGQVHLFSMTGRLLASFDAATLKDGAITVERVPRMGTWEHLLVFGIGAIVACTVVYVAFCLGRAWAMR